jgi:hypothetical protein
MSGFEQVIAEKIRKISRIAWPLIAVLLVILEQMPVGVQRNQECKVSEN